MADVETGLRKKAARAREGEAILGLITSARMRRVLVHAAEDGVPPLSAIAPELLAAHPAAVRDLQVRQLVGLCVRTVMADAGYVVALPRTRVANVAPFRFAATFRRPDPDPGPDLLERLVSSLSDAEARRALKLLGARLGRP